MTISTQVYQRLVQTDFHLDNFTSSNPSAALLPLTPLSSARKTFQVLIFRIRQLHRSREFMESASGSGAWRLSAVLALIQFIVPARMPMEKESNFMQLVPLRNYEVQTQNFKYDSRVHSKHGSFVLVSRRSTRSQHKKKRLITKWSKQWKRIHKAGWNKTKSQKKDVHSRAVLITDAYLQLRLRAAAAHDFGGKKNGKRQHTSDNERRGFKTVMCSVPRTPGARSY